MIRKSLILCLFLMLITACAFPTALQVPTSGVTVGLTDPAQGLFALHSYRATLRLSFHGIQLGAPSQWSQSFILTVSEVSKTRIMVTEYTGLDQTVSYFPALTGAVNHVGYFRSLPSDNCNNFFLPQGGKTDADLISSVPELAKRLPAPQAMTANGGLQNINGISVQPYDFNAAALQAEGANVVGKAWLAVDGGYLVKYQLQLKGGNDFFDKDTSGTFTWEYDLDAVNQPDAIALPFDCPLPLPDLPLPDGAQDVISFPGYTSFTTSASVSDTAAFYQLNVPKAGFQATGEPQVGKITAYLEFTQDSQIISVLISGETTTTTVEIGLSVNNAAQPGTVATDTPGAAVTEGNTLEGTPTPASTVDISSLSLPSGLTIYPGATDLQTAAADPSGAGLKYVTFHTSATPDQVVTYYQQELTRAGWQSTDQQTPTPDAHGHINFTWLIKGWLVTLTPDIDPQGGAKVMLTWMER